jgi:hypothetical protein
MTYKHDTLRTFVAIVGVSALLTLVAVTTPKPPEYDVFDTFVLPEQGFEASVGWDPVTGRGSALYDRLLAALVVD